MKTNSELIKEQIALLHKRGSNDYQTLLRQVESNQKKVVLNIPQLVSTLAPQKMQIQEWGRRTGKTTFRGWRWAKVNETMPGSSGTFTGPSYQYILTKIVPSIIKGLELFGYYKDLHYFIGKKPPPSWRNSWGQAYMRPERYDNYITFYTGVGIYLISQDVKGDGRAITTDFGDADECGELNGHKLEEDVEPTMSGTNVKEFENCPLFASTLYTGTTPLTLDGKWFTDYQEQAILKPKSIFFSRANALDNIKNIRKGYLEDMKAKARRPYIYDAEYLNIRPKFVEGGFYPLLDRDIHCYSNYDYSFYTKLNNPVNCQGDLDLIKGLPLILSIDWGASINCLTVNQHVRSNNEYRTLKSMYVLGDEQKIQDDLFKDFHNYYYTHQATNKEVFLWYDNTGNNRTGNTRATRAQQARKQLIRLGWKVHLMTVSGANPMHDRKYLLWTMMLSEKHHRLPRYRINKFNAKDLYVSMKNAETKEGNNSEIKKDKSSERSKKIPRHQATDLSDANDAAVFGMFRHLIHGLSSSLPSTRMTSRN